ncbi:MAG TPA: DUF2157 domain-containing protein [Candidatus Eisenbacteria bacterium]|nr:DUF2157 domain-containing protein [Candidatus Eisenbacteria bacterium]
MLRALENALQRWIEAGLLDAATAEHIRQFEAGREQPSGLRWQVLLALIFGAILLAAGIALFVAAHWDRLSPVSRFVVVMGSLVAIHLIALLVRPRFDRLAIVLHGVGTLAAGAAIALVGQIFNIQEHWPAGILLWALCALAGWALLDDQVQQTIALLLLPSWIVCEWIARTDGYRGSELMNIRIIAVIAAVYLTAFVSSQRKLVSGVLFAAGAVALATIAAGLVGFMYWHDWATTPAPPVHLTAWAWGVIAAALLLAWRMKPDSVVPAALVLVVVMVLPHCFAATEQKYAGGSWQRNDPTLVAYLIVAAAACFFAWWGVREKSKALINYGVVAFALTVLWFYFSNFMDKLNRSLGLIVLGVLFLGGGWLLEKLRRRMVGRVKEATP